jgi:hypothetical protein
VAGTQGPNQSDKEPREKTLTDYVVSAAISLYFLLMLVTGLGTNQWRFDWWNAKWPASAQTTPVRQGATRCDANYSGCVPLVPYDLDCGDVIGPVVVVGVDHHRLDGDGDGIGCE